ncbi:MAG: PEP-CTERM sorting domain-containing protein [Phycisphaerae bacterium]|nr:PEP-CTERM sorting domain-containing protein [Phycisphaerae bacterium]
MKKSAMIMAAVGLILAVTGTAQAAPLMFTETFDGSNAAAGGGTGSAFSGGLDNTGWTGATSGMASFLDAGGGFCMMSAMPFGMGSGEVSLSRTIGDGDNEIASLDATGSGGVQAVDNTTFSWIFADDAANSFQVSVDVVSYNNIRLQVSRRKSGNVLILSDVDMTDNGLGDVPQPPDPTDIYRMRLDWTATWDHATTEWGFEGTVTLQNDAGTITVGSYTQALVATTDYEASEQGRTMEMLQQLGSGMASAAGLNEVSMDIPEPATMCLLGLGALALIRRRK